MDARERRLTSAAPLNCHRENTMAGNGRLDRDGLAEFLGTVEFQAGMRPGLAFVRLRCDDDTCFGFRQLYPNLRAGAYPSFLRPNSSPC